MKLFKESFLSFWPKVVILAQSVRLLVRRYFVHFLKDICYKEQKRKYAL